MRSPSKIKHRRQFKKSQQDRWFRYFTINFTTYVSSEYDTAINRCLDHWASNVLKNSQLNQKVS